MNLLFLQSGAVQSLRRLKHLEHLVKYCCNRYYQLHGSSDGTYKCDENRMWVSLGTGKEASICKPAELAQKARKEIADYLPAGKDERARIPVEHVIHEDYFVETMEILELYCDLLLACFGLIQSMKELHSGLAEAVSALIWAAPRLHSEVAELKIRSRTEIVTTVGQREMAHRSTAAGGTNWRVPDIGPKVCEEQVLG
ncbi:uncharacterized protein LOC136004508 [Lathamus discolor]|uniref:uncharacterized protein LOC136004508 n=1 Tax=Lathamus discolor TaxID=678569 RepID=UPI0032B753E8